MKTMNHVEANRSKIQAPNQGPYSSFSKEYQSLVLRYREMLLGKGISVRAFSRGGLNRFLGYSFSEQEMYVSQLRDYYQICKLGELAGLDIVNDTKSMMEFTARHLNFSVPDEFISKIASQDIVEVFNYDNIQLYRNMNFFKISDYTVDDFFGTSWDKLYERAQSVTDKLIFKVGEATRKGQCIPFDIDPHYMREYATENRKIVKVNLKFVAPLMRYGKPVAWAASSSAEVYIPKTTNEAEKLKFFRSDAMS